MKYGLDIPPFGGLGDARTLADLARDAEAAGWDGFFIWDHIDRDVVLDIVDPWIALAAVAMQTERIRLGPLVTPLPRRRPWKVAREAVSLDHLSGGRLVLGVGLGSGQPSEWNNLGEETDLKRRGAMVDEALDIITGLWSGEPFSYRGQHYTVTDSQFVPVPVQQPRIPIWTGGYWPNKKPFLRAARWDGVFPLPGRDGVLSPEQIHDLVAFIREHRADDRPFDILHRCEPLPGADLDRAAARVAPYALAGVTWWIEALHPWHFGGGWDDWPVEAMRDYVRRGPLGLAQA
ncbi:MAG: LLM class flavin-dependent oxidoreductase [Anaerolineae bacterium]|nr:LLM class flavin-dependent oxidoreductase [Anaerolineae bacterium]